MSSNLFVLLPRVEPTRYRSLVFAPASGTHPRPSTSSATKLIEEPILVKLPPAWRHCWRQSEYIGYIRYILFPATVDVDGLVKAFLYFRVIIVY